MKKEKISNDTSFYDSISLLLMNEKAFQIGLIDQCIKDKITNLILSKEKKNNYAM